MKRTFMLFYGTVSYGTFLATAIYCVGFFGNIYVPRTIDSAALLPLGQALLVNAALILFFGIQHSGMARPAFKSWLARFLPPEIERSTYVLASTFALVLIILLWQPMGGVIWRVTDPVVSRMLNGTYLFGWAFMIRSTFLIDHFDLFGLRQVVSAYRKKNYADPEFRMPGAYRYVRHPIYVGWLLVIWSTPIMTATHLVISAGLTLYILVGIWLEERDLAKRVPCYAQYQRKVPMLIPSLKRRLNQTQVNCADIEST